VASSFTHVYGCRNRRPQDGNSAEIKFPQVAASIEKKSLKKKGNISLNRERKYREKRKE